MIRSFLKYAGGKYAILSRILPLLPPGKRLFEPFVGGGSVFLNAEGYNKYIISDANERLIDLWTEVRRSTQVIERAKELFTPENNTPEGYNRLRQQFRDAKLKDEAMPIMLYLNRHCFNGLWRESKRTGFNVPFGKYENPYFPEEELLFAHEKLQNAIILRGDFESIVNMAGPGDTVYCDPPFVPLTKTASFTGYQAGGFTAGDQVRLRDAAVRAAERGASVLISNHSNEYTVKLYKGAFMTIFPVASQISCVGENRHGRVEMLAFYGPSSQEDSWNESLHQPSAAISAF